jgi:hypothetical protein
MIKNGVSKHCRWSSDSGFDWRQRDDMKHIELVLVPSPAIAFVRTIRDL